MGFLAGAWLRTAGEAGFDKQAVTALIAVARQDLRQDLKKERESNDPARR